MSEIDITYKGSTIASMNASGTKTLLTEGKYCEDDIEVVYTRPSVAEDFIIYFTIDDSTYDIVADKTFAQIQAAYNANKRIIMELDTSVFYALNDTQEILSAAMLNSISQGSLTIEFFRFYTDTIPILYNKLDYISWTLYQDESTAETLMGSYYDTSSADASTSDVVTGMSFFNASGPEVGTL